MKCTRRKLDPTWVRQQIGKLSSLLISNASPEGLYLFGSAAEGKMTDQSDLDFLVVMESEDSIKKAQKKLRPFYPLSEYPVDLVWVTKDTFNNKKQLGGVCMVAFKEGKCLFKRRKHKQ
ncbi:MAG: nucleotidyltransferase domain-containing protein [Deltaproteobacteria bacterium]|nr:nucleotidyltransferase domain-containing protein [Deltaproteobacteria bacterium]